MIRTPSSKMMSYILIENICMSPFPSFEIPKMSGFRTNTDSSSINGEYLLESSLHPAPVSLWLDFQYKEKKKCRNNSKRKSIGKDKNNRTDVALYYFTRITRTSIPCFIVKQNQCFLHINSRANTGTLTPMNFILDSYTYNLYWFVLLVAPRASDLFSTKQIPENIASFTRQFLSHGLIFKLRHLKDLNLTQLTYLIRLLQENGNKKKSDSNDSNSSIIVSLYYLNVECVFQIDGECIVIRLSTLINRKEDKVFPCNNKKEELI